MKTAVLLVLALAAFALPVFAQTQAEMNQTAIDDYRKADKKLNVAYGQAKSALDEDAQEKLVAAQKAWITFRDAQAAFEADSQARGGTMAPLIFYTARTELTEARTTQLEAIAKGPETDSAAEPDAKNPDAADE